MASRVGGFKTQAHRIEYEQVYDRVLQRDWPVPHEELDIDTAFGPTRVRRSGAGDGTPLVMVHPTTGSSLGWYPVVHHLCADRVVYTPDTIGTCGRSLQTAPVDSVEDLVAWLDQVIDGLGLERLHLLGYSEGGWIAGSYAALSTRRDQLASVTLVEPGGAIERIPTGFLLTMIGRAMLAMASRDRASALARFSHWLNGDIELTPAQMELIEVSMGAFGQRLPRPDRLSDEDLARISCTDASDDGSGHQALRPGPCGGPGPTDHHRPDHRRHSRCRPRTAVPVPRTTDRQDQRLPPRARPMRRLNPRAHVHQPARYGRAFDRRLRP